VDFTTVLSAEATVYSSAEQVITVQQEALQASALLIQDLGGGWDASELPGRRLPKPDSLPKS
jgi:outer membrane protein TolC